MAAPQSATPSNSICRPSTIHCSVPSEFFSKCGILSPHLARDNRFVQTSGCSCTCSSTLMKRLFIAMLIQLLLRLELRCHAEAKPKHLDRMRNPSTTLGMTFVNTVFLRLRSHCLSLLT